MIFLTVPIIPVSRVSTLSTAASTMSTMVDIFPAPSTSTPLQAWKNFYLVCRSLNHLLAAILRKRLSWFFTVNSVQRELRRCKFKVTHFPPVTLILRYASVRSTSVPRIVQ
jgi:hypothetical protein